MSLKEKDFYKQGGRAHFYEQDLLEAAASKAKDQLLRSIQVIRPSEMPWEVSPHGLIKHLIHRNMPYPVKAVDLYMMELGPGAKSGKHRHMAEEILYIVEGKGHDLHWDADVEISDRYYWKEGKEGKQFEWEEGDFVYIPPMTAHQHFNGSTDSIARFLAATNRVYRALGYPDLEQLEELPRP